MRPLRLLLSTCVLIPLADGWAHDAPSHAGELEAIEVTGHYDNAVGTSDAASQGVITSRLLQTRPALRPGEVLEYVPGVIVTQHSGDGKANQYFLRGFNLDHGTDFATWVAGMPVNLPTHAHGHGYTDLNFLIPELIDRIAYRKGPYFASSGDFSSAGSAEVGLKAGLPGEVGQLTVGSNDYQRLFVAASPVFDGGRRLLAAAELQRADGPWDNPQGLRKKNAVLRLSEGTAATGYNVTLMAYQSRWDATDQIPQRAIDSGAIGRFGAVDSSDGGDTERYSLSAELHRATGDGGWRASVYAIHYRLDLFSNFTYFLDRPDTGDQFLQRDRRNVFGGQIARTWYGSLGRLPMTNEIGLQARSDRIHPGLFDSTQRTITVTTRDDRVRQANLGLYAENGLNLTPWLRSVLGLRADRFRWSVDSDTAANSGRTSDSLVSPKASLVFGPWARTEYFVNWGRGFHSNDARGTVARVDPRTGEPVDRVPGLVRTTGYEVGARTEIVPNLQSSVSLWRLDLGSELVFVGDAGTTEASRPSRRQGIEWSNRYLPRPWLVLDLDVTAARSRFTDDSPGGDRIPGAVSRVMSAAVGVRELGPWSGSLQLRYLGPRSLVEDGSVRARSTVLANARIGYRFDKWVDVFFDVFNLTDRKANDIEYYYASRLPGEPPGGIDDLHVHPVEPRTFRLSARVSF
jgi:outer membrane receptor protein involved in Fe transport